METVGSLATDNPLKGGSLRGTVGSLSLSPAIPARVFVVPYRNRAQHKFFFSKYMSFLLENDTDYEIYFSHQCDNRTFNRGATKNIGFLAVKQKYPDHYQDMTFVFHDVDTLPFNKIFTYQTTPGVVAHYYGFQYALGGIVVIKGRDFETIGGFPCYWGWGMEDNVLQTRCLRHNLTIDRSQFYPIGSPHILQLFDGVSRIISQRDPLRSDRDEGVDGLTTLTHVTFVLQDTSLAPADNLFVVHNPRIHYINITSFDTYVPFGVDAFYEYDLRDSDKQLRRPDPHTQTHRLVATPQDWTRIQVKPTQREQRKQQLAHLLRTGQKLPPKLVAQIRTDQANALREDPYA